MKLKNHIKIFNFYLNQFLVWFKFLLLISFILLNGCRTYASESEIRALDELMREVHQLESEVKLLKEAELNMKREDHTLRMRFKDCVKKLELTKKNLKTISGEKLE